jgi:hypothetical protein
VQFVDAHEVLDVIAGREYFVDWMDGEHPVIEQLEKEYMVQDIALFSNETICYTYAYR